MADDANFLNWASSTISSQSAEVEDKIDRLQKAKNDIIEEQETCMDELEQIKNPTLPPLWDGAKGNEYDEKREEAYSIMETIYTKDYESIISKIELNIGTLKLQRSALSVTSSLVDSASDLLNKGEDMVQELGSKIGEIKGRLFG